MEVYRYSLASTLAFFLTFAFELLLELKAHMLRLDRGEYVHKLVGHFFKELFHVVICLCTYSNYRHPICSGPFLLLTLNGGFEFIIAFVSQDKNLFRIAVCQSILNPSIFDVLKGLVIFDIEYDDDCVRSIEIRLGNIFESFLPSCIPNL